MSETEKILFSMIILIGTLPRANNCAKARQPLILDNTGMIQQYVLKISVSV
jgi:hypothetical protein